MPESWVWVNLNNIAMVGTGATPLTSNPSYYVNGKIAWVNSSVTSNDYITSASAYITEKAISETNCTIFPIGTLLIAMYGEGKTRGQISELKIEAATNQACAAIQLYLQEKALTTYVKYCFQNNYEILRSESKGGNQPNLNLTIISNFPIPLPPFAEQHRIVQKIEQCFTLINQIEESKLSLSQFIKQAKSKVLDLAIRGKLVSQDPNDEPVTVKNASDNLPYTNNEFELPNNWQITLMQNVCFLYDGEKIDGKKLPYLDVKYLRRKSEVKIISSGKFVSKNSTMILVDGENSGELFSVTEDGYQGSTFKILNISNFVDKNFIFKILQKEQSTFRESKVGSAIPHLDKKLFRELPVFLPPLAEQKRIVQKIESIFQTLDFIQNNL
jgi:type I restriction enzyme S subunit